MPPPFEETVSFGADQWVSVFVKPDGEQQLAVSRPSGAYTLFTVDTEKLDQFAEMFARAATTARLRKRR